MLKNPLGNEDFKIVKEAFINGNAEKINEYFTKYILSSFSYYNLNIEKVY